MQGLDPLAKPLELPECWWVEYEYDNGEVWLSRPSETRAAAEVVLELDKQSVDNWVRKPRSLTISAEIPDRRVTRRMVYDVSNPGAATARWNWVERNRDLLESASPRTCCVLPSLGNPAKPDQRTELRNKVGGFALLPKTASWPCIAHQPWDDFTWHARTIIAEKVGVPAATHRFRGGTKPASYLATYDLRDRFDFDESFPAAVSIFVSNYREEDDSYNLDYANSFQHIGVAVPIFDSDELESRTPPDGVPMLPEELVQPCDVPDFPSYGEAEELHDELESIEPGTEPWINLAGRKIGGYPTFKQYSLLKLAQEKRPDIEWHWIGCFEGLISFGDGGTLYLLAGRNNYSGKWQWHVEWQC
ncbi:MAG: DUF1963 domain-containing protein [Planctomycetota bacterium]